ncbi:MAG: ATP-binding protein [candidate division Zixibacteria bacterium]|nr:ATP-binding protein [candidate division Zixibacteria bacterium]
MPSQLSRWSPTLKLSALALILFFLISNFSFLWLSYKAKSALQSEIKAKLEGAAARLGEIVSEAPDRMEARKRAREFLAEGGLLACGFFEEGPLPSVWTNPQSEVAFVADYHPAQSPNLSGPNPFGGHFTCTYSFPASTGKGKTRPAGFVIARAESWGELERLFRIQTFFWIIGFALMAAAASLLWRFLLAPFETVEKKAAEARLSFTGGGREADPAAKTIESFERAIAELQAKERELSELYRESEKRAVHYSSLSKHLIESLGSGIILFDPAGRIVDFNPAAQELLGLRKGLNPPALWQKLLARVAPGRPAESVELEVELGPAKKILAASVSAISNPDGEALGKALLVSDLTEFKEMEKKLEEKEHWAFLGETAAGLAHELRNALAVMVGYTKLLAKAVGESHPSHHTAAELLKESRSAEETLKRFLDYARPSPLFLEKLNLRGVLDETVAALESQFPAVAFRVSAPEKTGWQSDAALLKQIFSNLLRNGAEAAGGGGWVEARVESSEAPEGWRITVSDSGPGIPAEIRKKIFSPFFTTRPEGTGLGLALVKKAVHLLEGEIQMGNENRKTSFVVRLPVRLREPAQKDKTQEKQKLH